MFQTTDSQSKWRLHLLFEFPELCHKFLHINDLLFVFQKSALHLPHLGYFSWS